MSKLYTEEQLRDAIAFGRPNISDLTVDDWIKRLTPIELPSDEEMELESNKYESFYTFFLGAKWMRDKIKGGDDGTY